MSSQQSKKGVKLILLGALIELPAVLLAVFTYLFQQGLDPFNIQQLPFDATLIYIIASGVWLVGTTIMLYGAIVMKPQANNI